jgi:hypothetical protein
MELFGVNQVKSNNVTATNPVKITTTATQMNIRAFCDI